MVEDSKSYVSVLSSAVVPQLSRVMPHVVGVAFCGTVQQSHLICYVIGIGVEEHLGCFILSTR